MSALSHYRWYFIIDRAIKVNEAQTGRRNSTPSIREVGGKLPNAYGLYDMIGNVYEWVWECHGRVASRRLVP